MAKYKPVILSHLAEHGPASVDVLFNVTEHPDKPVLRGVIWNYLNRNLIASNGKNPAQYSITDAGLEWLDEWEKKQQRKAEKAARPRRVFFPIKEVVLPALLEKSMTAEALFVISGYRGKLSRFKGGLTRLEQRNFLSIDRTSVPWTYHLADNDRAREHAIDPGKGMQEGVEKKKKMFSNYGNCTADGAKKQVSVKVTVKKPEPVKVEPPAPMKVNLEPVKVEPSEPAKTPEVPIRIPVDPVEERILDILRDEGAVTVQEVYELVRNYDTVRGHITQLLNAGHVKIDVSVDPIMYYTTPAFDEYIQERYAPTHKQDNLISGDISHP